MVYKKNKAYPVILPIALAVSYFLIEGKGVTATQVSAGTLNPIRQTVPNIYTDFDIHADLADF